jgi:hypothetical protein
VTGVHHARLEQQQIVDPLRWKLRNLWVGLLVFRFIARERRA